VNETTEIQVAQPEVAQPLQGGQFDAAFVGRVLRTSAVAAVLLAWMIYGWLGWRIGLGFLAGAAVSLGSLASIDWMVRRLTSQGGRSHRKITAVALAKIPLLALFAWLIVWAAGGNVRVVAAAVAGASLVPVVVVLKILGRWLVPPAAASHRGRSCG
jgi:hypothetical protein